MPSLFMALAILLLLGPFFSTLLRGISIRHDEPQVEWTALGDSYASGVGSTTYVSGWRCLRYDEAYPVQLNNDGALQPSKHVFNNCVCSGAKVKDVTKYQFYKKDTWGKPTPDYGSRPKFGNPAFATLTVGGDDIDFRGILFNCILDTSLFGGPPSMSCDEQRSKTWAALKDPKLIDIIDTLIKKTVTRGRSGTIGNDFKLYVTGYARFFNKDDPACNTVTFARGANPNPDGKEHTLMTQQLRVEFNDMSLKLNDAITRAVARNTGDGVTFIDIEANGALDGHRFCEPGINEPDQKNDNLWFWHYPYNTPKDPYSDILNAAYNTTTQGLDAAAINSKYNDSSALSDAVFAAVNYTQVNETSSDPNKPGILWFWEWVGWRAKVFHPKPVFHAHIRGLILAQYLADISGNTQNATSTSPSQTSTSTTIASTSVTQSSSPSTAPLPAATNGCHGITENVWVMDRDPAVQNVNQFCGQTPKSVEYNKGTVNDRTLSVSFPLDESKGVSDAPDCVNNFVDAVIDGCDGNDPTNNPHNHKFSGQLHHIDREI